MRGIVAGQTQRPLTAVDDWLAEHRGDGHVAVLTAAGIGGRKAHVLHALATDNPSTVDATARHFEAQEWSTTLATMAERGLVRPDGTLTEAGREPKRAIGERTDELAATGLSRSRWR